MNIQTLSPSMVNAFRKCPRQFYYRYVEQLPTPSNYFLAFGSSFHRTLEENYYQKVQSEKDLPLDLLTDFFAEDLESQDNVEWGETTLDTAKDQGVALVRGYQYKVGFHTFPQLVEHAWTMEIKNRDYNISGKIDLITTDDLIVDTKTTGKRVSKPKLDHMLQVKTYAAAWKHQTLMTPQVKARLDYCLRGKDEINSITVEIPDTATAEVLSIFDDVAGWIQREAWVPHRQGNFLCSRKYCSFWNQCEKDCGGVVKP